MRSRIRLRQLLLVDAIGVEGSLHKAGERLGMTQPNATKLLQELEKLLGVTLFERSKAGLIPTEHGRVMLRHARIVLADLEHARQQVAAVSDGIAGTVRIGTLVSNDPSLLAAAIGRASESGRTQLRIRVFEGVYNQLVERLIKGEIDLLLARGRDDPRSDDVTSEVLFQENFKVVCGMESGLASQQPVSAAALLEAIWILPPSDSLVRRNIDMRVMAECGRKPERVVEAVSVLTTLEMIQHGPFVGIMPPRIAKAFAVRGLLRIAPFELGAVGGPMVLLRRSTSSLAPAVESFIGFIRREAARHRPTETEADGGGQ